MNGRAPKSKSVGFYHVMEAFSTATNYPSRVETYRPTSPQRASTPPKRTPEGHTSPRNVSFGRNNINREEEKEKRQKYLTARYGQHQMMLIRKRLAVEDWLYDKLRNMYNCVDDADDHDCKLDLEDVLDLDTDTERQQYAIECLQDAKQPPDIIDKFVQELLQKANTL